MRTIVLRRSLRRTRPRRDQRRPNRHVFKVQTSPTAALVKVSQSPASSTAVQPRLLHQHFVQRKSNPIIWALSRPTSSSGNPIYLFAFNPESVTGSSCSSYSESRLAHGPTSTATPIWSLSSPTEKFSSPATRNFESLESSRETRNNGITHPTAPSRTPAPIQRRRISRRAPRTAQ